MSEFVYPVAKFSVWAFPALLVCAGLFAIYRGFHWAGGCFMCAGVTGLIWDFLFLSAAPLRGQPRTLEPIFIPYDDAPLGFFLSHLLPVISGAFLLAGILFLLSRSSNH